MNFLSEKPFWHKSLFFVLTVYRPTWELTVLLMFQQLIVKIGNT